MRLTFPHMGPIIAYKKLLEAFGHEVIMPQKPTQRTIDLGVKYSPEFLCFPFKCLLGTYIEALERGAEAVVTTGGSGACRAGFYGEVHRRILKSLGFNVKFYVIESPRQHFQTFMEIVKLLKGRHSWSYVIRTVRFCYRLIAALDHLEAKIRILRAHEKNKGDLARVWKEIKAVFDRCQTLEDIPSAEQQANAMIAAVPLAKWDPSQALRVGIVGEIYVAMERHANLEIEEALAAMGVEVVNSQYVSHWLQHKMKILPWRKSYVDTIIERATPYLKIQLGGHDKENIAHMIDFREQGVDGVVHLMPFACLPELVTQSIIPQVSRDLDMPILSLAIDEQRGSVNNQTRLEAFIDLIKNRKARKTAMATP